MTMGMPAAMSTRAALIFVIMPPDFPRAAPRLARHGHDVAADALDDGE